MSDLDRLGSRDVIDHVTIGLNNIWFPSYRRSIVANRLFHTVSEILRITGKKLCFYLPTLIRPKFDKSYRMNFLHTMLGFPSITILIGEITVRLSQCM